MENMYYLNGKKVTIDLSSLSVLSPPYTLEGMTYKYHDKALKVFYPDRDLKEKEFPLLRKDGYEYLQKLEREHYLFPIEILLDENKNFKGFTTKLIQKEKAINKIGGRSISSILKEALALQDETDQNSKDGIRIDDVMHNYIYNGNLYICDPGFYKVFINPSLSTQNEIEKKNQKELAILLVIITLLYKEKDKLWIFKNMRDLCKQYLKKYVPNYDYIEYMKTVCDHHQYTSIKEYAEEEKAKLLYL